MVISAGQPSYFRLVPGDVNGFLGRVVDNLSVLALLSAVLIGGYGVPTDIVFGKMLRLDGAERNAAIQFCAAYFVLAGVLLLLSLRLHRGSRLHNKI